MRVIAGTARSLPLKTLSGRDTRPTTDRIKETLFNILHNDLPGCIFVDVYSGSGGIGIEALSRGAARAYFIENAAPAAECIRANLEFTKLAERGVLLKQDGALGLLHIPEQAVDIIFMDPPYGQDMEEKSLRVLAELPYITDETLVIVETALGTDFPYLDELGFKVVREKRYKTNKHVFIRRDEGIS